ncbi:hemolysin/hemagglutinin-like protein HecA precursor [Photorhabdus khanii]|uniref:Hemolysin/hemagglutinin-like protein HecA n=1 Tax=Photorhabdus khanii TaxID=1004150 RepID=A0A7C9GRS2_9GAMM|nr:hemolysin/hemagglutinin-like protein HecA precursor [Photorhabdus khanii]
MSTLSTLAAGLAGGIAGDSTGSVITGAQTGKNAIENNHLSVDQNRARSEELVNCQGDSSCRATVRDKYRQEYDRVQARIATCSGADQCVAVAKELRALQGDYSARMSEIQEKARMQGLDSLTPAEVREWADLRGAMSNIDASRNLVLHRAQVTGGSEETTQEIVKIMGQTGIAASAGVAGGISKAGAKGGKGSAIPAPDPVTTNNGLVYKSNPKHTPGQIGYHHNAGTEPKNSIELFGNSVASGKKRYALDSNGNVHQFTNTNDGTWHWSGSTGDKSAALSKSDVPSDVKKKLGLPGKWR